MPQYYRLSIQRDCPFADERVLLWRLMRGGCNIASNAPSLISSNASYMQSDTILRAIKELTQDNISYTSNQGKTYDFNAADKLNALLIRAEYLHRKPGLCKTFQNWIRVRHSLWLESAYCFKSHCGVRGGM